MYTDLVTPHEVNKVLVDVDEGRPLGCQAIAQHVLALRRMQELHPRMGGGECPCQPWKTRKLDALLSSSTVEVHPREGTSANLHRGSAGRVS